MSTIFNKFINTLCFLGTMETNEGNTDPPSQDNNPPPPDNILGDAVDHDNRENVNIIFYNYPVIYGD